MKLSIYVFVYYGAFPSDDVIAVLPNTRLSLRKMSELGRGPETVSQAPSVLPPVPCAAPFGVTIKGT